jgi:hypothetical protein
MPETRNTRPPVSIPSSSARNSDVYLYIEFSHSYVEQIDIRIRADELGTNAIM